MSHNITQESLASNRPRYQIDYARIPSPVDGDRKRSISPVGTCSNHTPTVSVHSGYSDVIFRPDARQMPGATRYTLDLSGWEIKTNPETNKRYIDVYLCIKSFMTMLAGDSAHPFEDVHDDFFGDPDGFGVHKHPPADHDHHGLYSGYEFLGEGTPKLSTQFTGHRIVFYKSKGTTPEQTKLFQSKLGTVYNKDTPENAVNCTDAPSDENTTIGRCCYTWTLELEGINGACSNHICALNPNLCGASACYSSAGEFAPNTDCGRAVINVFEKGGIATSAFTDLIGNVYQPGQSFPANTICNPWGCNNFTYKQCKNINRDESPLGARAPWRSDPMIPWNSTKRCDTQEFNENGVLLEPCYYSYKDAWLYQCGEGENYSDFNYYVADIKDAWNNWIEITGRAQPILNYSSNKSTPESVIFDTGCIKEAHCASRSRYLGVPDDFTPVYSQKEPHEDSHLKALSFQVTEDDAEFDNIIQDYWFSGKGHDTGPYIYFIILPNCGYQTEQKPGVFVGLEDLAINIGCTPRGALPCNFTDQECDLCLRGNSETWDYKEYSREIVDALPSGEDPKDWQWIRGQWDPNGFTGNAPYGENVKCKSDEEYDCQGHCFPSAWLNDTICHSNSFHIPTTYGPYPSYRDGQFWHPQGCSAGQSSAGYCFETDGEAYIYSTINLNCPRFSKQVEKCSWKNNSQTPLCKGICCEIYQGVFTGACSIKPRNECKLYRNPGLGISTSVIRGDYMRNGLPTDNPVLQFYNSTANSSYISTGAWGDSSYLEVTPSIELEGGYFWEISSNDTVASADTCSVCSTLKGTKTDGGCGYFGCCDEVGVSDFKCSPSGFWTQMNAWGYSSNYSGEYYTGMNPISSWGTNSSELPYGFDDTKESYWHNSVFYNRTRGRGAPAGWYQEMLVKEKSNGYFSGIAAPTSDEMGGHGLYSQNQSEMSPDYTQNNMGVRACCIGGECSLRTIDNCKQAGGFFHINLVVCNDIFCEPDRVGRCCELKEGIPTGDCLEITRTECDGIVGKNWLIDEQGNPVACKRPIYNNGLFLSPFWPASSSAGRGFDPKDSCRFNTQCASLTRDSRACCLGDTCETLLISHCLELEGTPDLTRYTCAQGTPVEGSTPTDIKYINCALHHTLGETKWWCNPKCVDKVCQTPWFGIGEWESFTFPGGGPGDPHNHSWDSCCTLGWDAGPRWHHYWKNCVGRATSYKVTFQSVGSADWDINPAHGDKGLELWKECGWDHACGLGPFYCGSPKSGSCCKAHNSPFCSSPECCARVCELLPECCEDYWSEECAEFARLKLCPELDTEDCLAIPPWSGGPCGDPDSPHCCSQHVGPGCESKACCEAVCVQDLFCCDVRWDSACAYRASNTSACDSGQNYPPNYSCSGPVCGSVGTGSCFEPHTTPYCAQSNCCSYICGVVQPDCCQTAWDEECVALARLFCSP